MIPRRALLKWVGCAAAANGCSVGGVPPADVGDVAAGNASGLAVGTLAALPREPVCIGRDAGGVYSMTLICPHQGCDIGQQGSVSDRGLYCACHGSSFDIDGNVVGGPARSPLAHFAVSADPAGNITVHTGTQVDSTTRLAVG